MALEVAPTELLAVASPAPESARLVAAAAVVDRRARAVELRESGWSNKKIARSLDVHPSTVGRWFAGAHHPDEPEQPRAVLEGATP